MQPRFQIRVGVEGRRRPVLAKANEIGAPLLVSANSLWDNKRKKFSGWECYGSHDTALDSGGFIAMKKYGGYRWTVEQYVSLAKAMNPSWWAQMDFCCEPEIAGSRNEVFKRIDLSAEHLQACAAFAKSVGVPLPMPVLQGWMPGDYCEGPIYKSDFEWPSLVGIGSVCRRRVSGSDGILAVVNALNRRVPSHVRFHLFGVKSEAIRELLANFPHRIASVDSMAWNMACRFEAHAKKVPCNGAMRADYMANWFLKQTENASSEKQPQFIEFL